MLIKLIFWLSRFAISLRYRVEIKGLENITPDRLNLEQGLLLLPNHVAFVDPFILTIAFWNKWKPRPMMVEYVYYMSGLHWIFRKVLRAIPMPDFQWAMNSYKVFRAQQAIHKVSEGLKRGENFLVYPSGRLKRTGEEVIGGASAIYDLLQKAPEANVVLVRTVGLWGSIFGWGITGTAPEMIPMFIKGLKILLKNFIFFTPRRTVTIELELAPASLKKMESKQALNQYLESWYNRPFGKAFLKGEREPEHLTLVSYSFWKQDLPEVTYNLSKSKIDIQAIPKKAFDKVRTEVSGLAWAFLALYQ